jgi:hypothetical protein
VGKEQVLAAVSGGVDSSVAAALVQRAVGDQLTCVFVDTGLLRHGEPESVVAAFGEMARTPPPFEQVRVPTLLVLGEQSYLPYDHLLDGHLHDALGAPGGGDPQGVCKRAHGSEGGRAVQAYRPLKRLPDADQNTRQRGLAGCARSNYPEGVSGSKPGEQTALPQVTFGSPV